MSDTEKTGTLKKYADILGKGIVAEFAPEIVRGMLIEMFKMRQVTTKKVVAWVENNSSLWATFDLNYQSSMKQLAGRVGNFDWLTGDWVIGAIKGEYPTVASLFMGWRKSRNWLERQIELIKKELEKPS